MQTFTPDPLTLARPPFSHGPALTVDQRTEAFEAARARMASIDSPMHWCLTGIVSSTQWPPNDPLLCALSEIARAIDAGQLSRALPFHDRMHFCDVTLAAHYLGRSHSVETNVHQLLVAAAVIHDLGHDGKGNGATPFRLERQSLALAQPLLTDAGVDETIIRQLAAIVLATDIANGLARARAWFFHHWHGAPPPSGAEPIAEFALFQAQPSTAWLAVALSEADALASAGLSIASAEAQEARLASEQGRVARGGDKLAYLDAVFPDGFLVATDFAPNLTALREHVRTADHRLF